MGAQSNVEVREQKLAAARGRHRHRQAARTACAFASAVAIALAGAAAGEEEQEEPAAGPIEEVLVTAQRVEESVQDVPVAVTALTGDLLEEKQVITPSDLQLNAPNVAFTATNFGGSSFSIRGIGNLVIGRTGEPGVSAHLNEIAVPNNLNATEFFDMERVEVLRGPQGTLFGRNATGGVINFVTRKPRMGAFEGFLDLEGGSYGHVRWKTAVNLPLGDTFAARVSGFQLRRDGYVENLAYGQTDSNGRPAGGIDDDVDGRDILSLRATLAWEPNDNARAWFLYSVFNEDDDRVRISNQVCVRNPLPTTGCLPNEFGFETPHLGATTAGIFAGLAGAQPLGAATGSYDFIRPTITGFRQMHTDFEPIFQQDEEILAFGAEYDFANYSLSLVGASRHNEYLSQQDYGMDVNASLGPTAGNPSGSWPVSAPAGGAGAEWREDSPCNLQSGTAGVSGGCILGVATNRIFAYDQLDSESEFWTVEAKVRTLFDGPYNFQIGASAFEGSNHGGYYVLANTLDLVTIAPPSVFPGALYPGFFMNANDPDGGAASEGTALFGELYYDVSERLTLTGGLRFNRDEKSTSDTSALANAIDANGTLGNLITGTQPLWLRVGLFTEMAAIAGGTASGLSQASNRMLEYNGAADVYAQNGPAAIGVIAAIGAASQIGQLIAGGQLPLAAVPATVASLGLPELFQATVLSLLTSPAAAAADPGLAAGRAALLAIAGAVPPVPAFGETRFVTGSPTEASWSETSGRIGFDYRLDDGTLVYGFYSRGYKPGGFNPAIPPEFQDTSAFTFDAEAVDAFEVGVKGTLAEGRLQLNAAGFLYTYGGLQVTRIRNNSSINDNVDANLMGLEVEGLWRPERFPGLAVDFSYGYLQSEVDGSMSLDPVNRTAGDASYILLNNIDPGAVTGVNFIAREAQITAAVVQAAIQNGATIPVPGTLYPANSAGVAIPAYFSRNFLNALGVETSDGLLTDLDGNQLPNAPDHTFKVGFAHTWTLDGGATLTGRWDYYWQSESYAREFNSVGDEIDSWSQHNAAAMYENRNWTLTAWVRNILDDDNVTGKYLTSDTSGFFRNYFLTEPRIFGVSMRLRFGED